MTRNHSSLVVLRRVATWCRLQAVHNGVDLLVKFHWADATKNNDKSPGLQEDRVALMIRMNSDAIIPCMKSNSALQWGTADEWHWKAARTDGGGVNFTYVERRGIAFNLGEVEQWHGAWARVSSAIVAWAGKKHDRYLRRLHWAHRNA